MEEDCEGAGIPCRGQHTMSAQRLTPIYRPYDPEGDVGLVMDSWCKAIRPPRPGQVLPFTHMTKERFRDHRALIELLLERFPPIIAHPKDFPPQIYGFACGGKVGPFRVLHFAYVRNPWRKQGVLSGLLDQLWGDHVAPGYVTHETKLTKRNMKLWSKLCKGYGLQWNPYFVAFSGGG